MEYRDLNDNEMLYLICENNEEAYGFMYKKYEPLINKFAIQILNKYKHLRLEYDDLFQEGMYALSLAIKKFDHRDNTLFFTLVFLCIKREMYKLVIKANCNKNSIINYSLSFEDVINDKTGAQVKDFIYDKDDILELKFENAENKKYILDLKYSLKPAYSEVYELKLNGFSNQNIADLLDLRYKDVDNYLRSIKNILKKKTHIEYFD